MKACKQCGQGKPLADYYAHPHYPDGRLPNCKECHKENMRANRRRHAEYYRRYDTRRAKDSDRVENTARVVSGYRARHPERVAANNAVARAVRSGRLVKPEACWCCGSDVGVGGHHSSYDRDMRLCVTWLCQACHKRVHEETLDLLHYTPPVMDNRTAGSPVHHTENTCPT